MKNVKQIALEWNASERTVNELCKAGKIPGVFKLGRAWQIPDDAVRPIDHRVVTGKYQIRHEGPKKKLPIGISSFIRAQEGYFYIDKTILIKKVLDRGDAVTLFTRPRRFGKTLNMDMMRVYFEKSNEDTSKYFTDKIIWAYGEEYRKHQGKYPVIWLSLKDAKFSSFESTLEYIGYLIQEIAIFHHGLEDSSRIDQRDKALFSKLIEKKAGEVELAYSLRALSRLLYLHYQTMPIIFIDEYDTPVQAGYDYGYYEKMVSFMRLFLSNAFKDNPCLRCGFLTGITRIAQESIFSGLNNLHVDTVLDCEYEDCFGFDFEYDVSDILSYYGHKEKKKELDDWYDGYHFGREHVYNPWSVINYVSCSYQAKPYWTYTSSNAVIKTILRNAKQDTLWNLYKLMEGQSIVESLSLDCVYPDILCSDRNLYSFLLVTGYLTSIETRLEENGMYRCRLVIPNREVLCAFKAEILSVYLENGTIKNHYSTDLEKAIRENDASLLEKTLNNYLAASVSCFDVANESFYHGLTLGFMAMLDHLYLVKSNMESGFGRFYIGLFPRNEFIPGIIIELKIAKKKNELQSLAEKALAQIERNDYKNDFEDFGVKRLICLGVACYKKEVFIASKAAFDER